MREAWQKVERHLDEGRGSASLKKPVVSRIVMNCLMEGHGKDFRVHAAVVMPNHVHAVLEIHPGSRLSLVAQRIKGASSRQINKLLGRRGRLWQPEYFDRLIRNEDHLRRCIGYTLWNPVKAGLCEDPRRFASSTANEFYARQIAVAD